MSLNPENAFFKLQQDLQLGVFAASRRVLGGRRSHWLVLPSPGSASPAGQDSLMAARSASPAG